MPYFTALETYGNNFEKLCNILPRYDKEVGGSGVREGAMEDLLSDLQAAFSKAKKMQQANMSPQISGAKDVKGLASFHTGQQFQNKQNAQQNLNMEVVKLRQWLSRQGAWFSGEDNLNWPQTMRLRVIYDSELSRQGLTKVTVAGNRLYTADGKPLDTSKMVTYFSGPGYAIYVMSAEGNLHVHSHSVGHFHHSSLLAGARVAGAGEIQVTNGKIMWLSNKSGHYQPGLNNLLQVLGTLQKNGIDLDFALTVMPAETHFGSVAEFMASRMLDNPSIEAIKPVISTIMLSVGTGGYLNATEQPHVYSKPGGMGSGGNSTPAETHNYKKPGGDAVFGVVFYG